MTRPIWQAVERIESWLEASLDAYQTIGVETVLSSGKYRRLVDRAHARGFEVRMIYVVLDTVDRQLARIRLRVADGGHDVPSDKVAARRLRSFAQFAWFIDHVDHCYIYDNSTGEPELAAAKIYGPVWLFNALPADLQVALQSMKSEVRTKA